MKVQGSGVYVVLSLGGISSLGFVDFCKLGVRAMEFVFAEGKHSRL